MKSKIFLLTAWLTITSSVLAQNPAQEYKTRMDHIFMYMDKSRITTGLLSDYGLQMVDPVYFNGIPADSNYVDMDIWKQLYIGMYGSKINSNVSLTAPETVYNQIEKAVHSTATPIAVMHFQYNKLNDDAVKQGLVAVVNGQIREMVGKAASRELNFKSLPVSDELHFSKNKNTINF
jgi:hypothetical protein